MALWRWVVRLAWLFLARGRARRVVGGALMLGALVNAVAFALLSLLVPGVWDPAGGRAPVALALIAVAALGVFVPLAVGAWLVFGARDRRRAPPAQTL